MTRSRSPILRRIGFVLVVLVPLAFAGLFVGALSGADDALTAIPAAIVNDDTLVTQEAPDGTEMQVLAGRQLVTELTGPASTGFDWTISNDSDAREALESGEVYAILTVPANFSASIISLSGDDPVKANISIRTDDAHSYVTGALAQIVGQGLTSAFGEEVTKQYIGGLYTGLGTLGSSLADAADGADSIADGASDLGDGLSSLADGAARAASGAETLAGGLRQYTGGVGSLGDGLAQLDAGADGLDEISEGIDTYTEGVGEISENLTRLNAVVQAYPTIDPQTKGALQQLSDGLATAADGGSELASGAAEGINGIQSGIGQSADGAKQLDAGSSQLVGGAGDLADGLDDLSTGAGSAEDGATALASGAGDLAEGLSTGADQVPSMSEESAAETAAVASDPVTFSVRTDNALENLGQGIATLFVPLGLWIGAIATFLLLRPVTRRLLVSTASSGRLVLAVLSRAAALAIAQALLLVALMHTAIEVPWSLLPATLGLAVLMALAFTAFHHLLTVTFGRGGLVVSILLLAIQVTSTGGIYPVEVLAEPFRAISAFLPLTQGISGMQAILVGGSAGTAVASVAVLALLGVLSVLLTLLAMRRSRRVAALGLVPERA